MDRSRVEAVGRRTLSTGSGLIPAQLNVDSPSSFVMVRLDRVITLNLVLMPMARPGRPMTKREVHRSVLGRAAIRADSCNSCVVRGVVAWPHDGPCECRPCPEWSEASTATRPRRLNVTESLDFPHIVSTRYLEQDQCGPCSCSGLMPEVGYVAQYITLGRESSFWPRYTNGDHHAVSPTRLK